ncbi:unnamed protein product [Calypogeia fissa]
MRRVDNANQTAGTGTFNNYEFDFGLGNGLGKGLSNAPLKDQKPSGAGFGTPWTTPQVPKSAAAAAPQSASSGWATGAGWSSSQSKPQAAGGLGGYSSSSSQTWGSSTTSTQTGWAGYQPMTQGLGGAKPAVAASAGIGGGIGGIRSMNAAPMTSSLRSDGSKLAAAGIAGVAQSQSAKADVFGDLLSSALNKSNAPINSKPVPKPSSFSMGNLDSSLPKPEIPPVQNTPMAKIGRSIPAAPAPAPESVARRQTTSSAERDPFPPVSASSSAAYENDFFSFPNGTTSANAAPTPMNSSSSNDPFGLSGSSSNIGASIGDPFAFGGPAKNVPPTRAPPPPRSTPVVDPFDVFNNVKPSPSIGRKPVDPMDSLFSKSTPPPSKSPPPAPVQDDGWGIFGGGSSGGSSGGNEPTTTELEGLPPPPSGVTATSANEKGSEFYKNGQFPDAIKWLSWSVELLKTNPDKIMLAEVLTCRISCFKEIGEMKKAVADCTQAIELQPTNVSLLMLRSNLYESMEKYKLGVADLKLVVKLDNGNLKARQTLTRLERIAAQ